MFFAEQENFPVRQDIEKERLGPLNIPGNIYRRIESIIDLTFQSLFEFAELLEDYTFLGRTDAHEVNIGQEGFIALGERSVDKRVIDRAGFSQNLFEADDHTDCFSDDALDLFKEGMPVVGAEVPGIGSILADDNTGSRAIVERPLEETGFLAKNPTDLLNVKLPVRIGVEEPQQKSFVLGESEHGNMSCMLIAYNHMQIEY